MGRTINFDFRRGGGSAAEVLYGTLTLTPSAYHQTSAATVLPEATKVELNAGLASLPNVEPSPSGESPAWVYVVTVTSHTSSRAWSFMVGVPDGTTAIAFKDLPKYLTPGKGVQIVTGKSAYQTAVDKGFVGTEAQWLATLVGPVGPAGPNTVPTDSAIATGTATYRPESRGAVGDGVTNDYAALNSAAGTAATFGADLLLTAPSYNLGTSILTLPVGTRLVGKSKLINTLNSQPVIIAQSDTTISGVTLENRGALSRFLLQIAGNATNVNIVGVKFPASANTTGVYANSANISNVRIEKCNFDGVRYGILVNSAANNIANMTVSYNTFTNIANDGIEINLPSGGPGSGERSTGTGFMIDHNIISVPDSAADGRSGGFGIGVAGATGVTIDHNIILEARYEGIHVEDDARDVVISGNIITNILGTDAYAAIHVLPSCQNVVISDNSIRNVNGSQTVGGIVASYDGTTTVHTSHLIVTGNTVRDVTGVGISVSAGSGGRHRVTDNDVTATTSHGIQVSGTPRLSVIHDNTVTTVGGYGVFLSNAVSTNFGSHVRDNIVIGATLGDYNGFAIAAGFGTQLTTRYASFTPTAPSTTTTLEIPLFRVGGFAQGTVRVTGRKVGAPNDRAQCVFTIRWDGTSLTYGKINSATLGGMTSGALRVTDGVLVWRSSVGAVGVAVEGNAYFDGTIIESGATFTGIVEGVIPALGAAATDAATTQALANNIRTALIAWGIATA